MFGKIPITIAYGDGIGPEIMKAVLLILHEAKAPLKYDEIVIGSEVYERGIMSGIEPASWNVLKRNKIFLKAPITTPQGKGVKSLNVTIRKSLGLYANVRPCKSYNPFIAARHPDMDVVIVRENEEDLYGGIEHQQTPEVVQCLKLISVPGCERIVRFAFEYAKAYNRKKISCFTKDNIMKLSDGLFHKIFDEISEEYPDIESEHMIIDIGTARLADTPERFDVVVVPNLYGDILSDVAAQIAGSVGLVGSANIGTSCAMFEAIHGSAPDIAGKNIANPSGLLMAAVMMLVHLGEAKAANLIQNAWLKTLEDGIYTPDIYNPAFAAKKTGTLEFAEEVAGRLGKTPQKQPHAEYPKNKKHTLFNLPYKRTKKPPKERDLVGIDVFLFWGPGQVDAIIGALQEIDNPNFIMTMVTNRGTKVWPEGHPETFCTDHWRCRFKAKNGAASYLEVLQLLTQLHEHELEVIKTENLYEFDGKPTYSLGQGE
jgi:isocitrate dehydrogenase